MKKTFAVYYNREINERGQLYTEEVDRPFNIANFDISDSLAKKDIDFVLITRQNPYVGNGQFFGYWVTSDNYTFSKREGLIKPDYIFDKGHIDFNDGMLNFFNAHDFARLGRNKYTQSVIVGDDYIPATVLVCGEYDYPKVLEKIKTDKIVAKPLDKNCGNGVTLYNREELNKNESFPVIMQEYVETQEGIEGMVEGRHDIRLYIVDGEAIMCAIRQPVEGGWLSNVHQGGTIHYYSKEQIPATLLEFSKPIIEKFNQFGGLYYSVDFMHGNNRWYMVEMNDRPILPALYQDTNGAVKAFYDKFTAMIDREIHE